MLHALRQTSPGSREVPTVRQTWPSLLAKIGAVLLLTASSWAQSGKKQVERPTFRVGVETVFVKISVTDPLNRYVTGLEKQHFKVYEDKVEQGITHFTQESAPISVGILFDISGSMKDNIHTARNSVVRFLESGNPDDEFFLVTFNQKTTLVQSFTHQSSNIQNQVSFSQPGGRTALYDAVYLGLEQIKNGKNEKKALILITDGEDNSSRYTASEVREFAKESDVQIYAIGEEGKLGYGRSEIQNIVGLTGGRAFFPNNFNELDYYIDLIHAELRNQYIVGYAPSNKNRDGKWRRIKVKLEPPEGLPKLIVHAKEGYYAPKN
ncbi:MAG: VWA domain-containing protein [Acidobacteria bacterium]|nr:MAG: VWA domain-containing protein [Acidobacteriota bacterium]PYU99706.1 MAG: VWA domain-containing protein [Acidobacteriota bacterium]PYV42805.1 MAG: VWA domain-containing protein [Acidobacteriota bacterium]